MLVQIGARLSPCGSPGSKRFGDRSPDSIKGGPVKSSCVDHQGLADPRRRGRFQGASRQTAPTGLLVWSSRGNDENCVDVSIE